MIYVPPLIIQPTEDLEDAIRFFAMKIKLVIACQVMLLVVFGVSCSTAQNLTVVEEKSEKCFSEKRACVNYVLIKDKRFFDGYGTILRDTTSEANRYSFLKDFSRHYIVDVAMVEGVENSFRKRILTEDAGDAKDNRYRNFYRQYAGYINNQGDTIVVINLLDFNRKGDARKFFRDVWKYQNYGIVVPCLDCKYPSIEVYAFNKQESTFKKM